MDALGIKDGKRLFIPPYEWWNRQVADWCHEEGVQLINFTSGTRSNADYTYPEMGKGYISSEVILQHLKSLEAKGGLNGAVLLIHAGMDPRRKDRLYDRLPELISYLRGKGYTFTKVDKVF
jgi:peptidoglycan/xylan/chitin deacetylase (PgdA/CDA1 family)